MKIVFVVNVDWAFITFRLPLAEEALRQGWEVLLITKDTGRFDELKKLGIKCINIDFERSGKNPVKELKLIFLLRKLYKQIEPNVIHQVTLKPSIYGTIALKRLKSKAVVVNAVSGLGYLFTTDRKSLAKGMLLQLMRWAFKNKTANFIFQNPDDYKLYDKLGFLTKDNNVIIKGSGVDEEIFAFTLPIVKQRLEIVLLARMLKDKGVVEFIEAANLLRSKFENKVKFVLIGGIDLENPAHITEQELKLMCDQEYIEWRGYTKEVKRAYEQSDIVCLPSYREGLPKSLVEAMAIGRPIITTYAIGCRECVVDGVNGYLVPIKNSTCLAEKIEELILNEQLRIKMGEQSRQKMVKEMSLSRVISETFKIYRK